MEKLHIFNNQKWQRILPEQKGLSLYVLAQEYDIFNRIYKQSKSDYRYQHFINQLYELSTHYSLHQEDTSEDNLNRHPLLLGNTELKYLVNSGNIYIENLDLKLYSRNKNLNQSGLFEVVKDKDSLKIGKTLGISNNSYIVINGAFKDDTEMLNALPKFIKRGYNTYVDALNCNEYNLFYNPCDGSLKPELNEKFHFRNRNTTVADQLACLIKLEAKKGTRLNWVVHEKGASLFKLALNQLIVNGSLNNSEKNNLRNQRVFYANPIKNLSAIDYFRKKCGMQLSPNITLINIASLRQTWISFNFFSSPHILFKQISELGVDDKTYRTYPGIIAHLFELSFTAGLFIFALFKTITLGVTIWVAVLVGFIFINRPGINSKAIGTLTDMLNDFFDTVAALRGI